MAKRIFSRNAYPKAHFHEQMELKQLSALTSIYHIDCKFPDCCAWRQHIVSASHTLYLWIKRLELINVAVVLELIILCLE